MAPREHEAEEPQHPGITRLSQASDTLRQQVIRMRSEWRSVSSLYRMQALSADNRILGLAGIHRLLLRGLETHTVPETADLVEVELSGYQYENVHERISPWRVNGIPQAARDLVAEVVNGGALDSLPPHERNGFPELNRYRSTSVEQQLDWLLEKLKSADCLSRLPGSPIGLAESDQSQLLQLLEAPAGHLKGLKSSDLTSILDLSRIRQIQGSYTVADRFAGMKQWAATRCWP